MNAMRKCNRELLVGFLTDRLEIDDRLDLLAHLDDCVRCWEEIYNARKSEHPHFYKNGNRQVRINERELKRIDALEEVEYQVA